MISPPPPIVVCDLCKVRTLDAALRLARAGMTIVIRSVQTGDFVVTAPVTITGEAGGTLDGGGRGTVLTIRAAGVTVRNLAIRHGGYDFVAMDSGIRANAPHTTIASVQVSDTLFGIYLAHADASVIEGNLIRGRRAVAVPMRGDGIRVWYSRNVRITGNRIDDARDDLIWFSHGATLTHNTVTGGRYGFHSMYSNDMTIEWNVVRNCQVGSYMMYGRNLRVEHNIFADNRGSTGYGIGLKSIDGAAVDDNAFVSNHAGIYVDNSPSLEGSVDRFERNVLAYNEIGFAGLPSSRDDVLLGNSFMQNYRQVSVLGGGTLAKLTWSQHGRGNYWSDYAGYNRSGDGIGDVSYQDRSVYGTLADVDSRLGLLTYSPAAKALDFSANVLPIFAPPPVLTDTAPLMAPVYPQGLLPIARAGSRSSYASVGLFALAAAFGVLVPFRTRLRKTARLRGERCSSVRAVFARGVSKRFGRTQALNGVDLDVRRGETLALWGANGSGKTTLMRALLGIIHYEGSIAIDGTTGYVPQHLPLFDMRVGDLAEFVAGLRNASREDEQRMLEQVGLTQLRERNVSELSGGGCQRLAIALAGLGDPDVLLLDEPTVGLDLASRSAILRSLKAAKAMGKTIIIASHIPEDVMNIADRIAIMEEGRIITIATPAEFGALVDRRREAL